MTNRVAHRILVAVRVGQAAAIAAVCAGIAALFWNGVAYCGGGMRQLFLPKKVTFGDGHVQSYVPYCTHHEVHTLGIGLALLTVGFVTLFGLRQVLAGVQGLTPRRATTALLWGVGMALLGVAIIPVENFAVGSYLDPTRHALMLTSRISNVPGALVAVGGVTMAVLSIRRLRSRTK